MSVEAKVFVTCGKERLFDVMETVIADLNSFVREEVDKYWQGNTDHTNRFHFLREDYRSGNKRFSNGVQVSAHNFKCIWLDFGCGDSCRRSLAILPDCYDVASEVYGGEKIVFSIGHWGMCDEIMKTLCNSLQQFGDVYYDHNDCDNEDFILVDE